MLSPTPTRYLVLFALLVGCSLLFVSPAHAQYKIELQTCEVLKITETQYGISVVETATCIKPHQDLSAERHLAQRQPRGDVPDRAHRCGDHLHGHEE